MLTIALGLTAMPAAAQGGQATEVGIQGGFARLKFTGTNQADAIDFYDIPGSSYFGLLPTYTSLFVDVPVGRRLAPTVKLAVASGATLAWGYRFPLTAALGGRVETSYTMYKQQRALGFRAVNALAISAGATFPL